MSLDFDAANRVSVVSNSASIENLTEFSVLVWLYVTSTANDDGILYRVDSVAASSWRLLFAGNDGALQFAPWRSGGVGVHQTTNANGLDLNKWECVAIRFDSTNGGDIFKGDLTTPLAEVTYSSDSPSSGALNTMDGDLFIGNSFTSQSTRMTNGRIAVVKHWDTRLSLNELIAQQWTNSPRSDLVLHHECGWSGTTTQNDLSGNGNSGTLTGGTLADHVPLPFGSTNNVPYVVAAAAGNVSNYYYTKLMAG